MPEQQIELTDADNPFWAGTWCWHWACDVLTGTVAPTTRGRWIALVDGWGNVTGRGDSAESAVRDALANVETSARDFLR